MAATAAAVRGIVLFPGSGSSADHPSLLAIERALSGVAVRRCDFPYRKAGKRFPDRGDVLVGCVRDEVASLADELGCDPSGIVIGGRSMGGRMCTLAAAGFSGARHETAPTTAPLDVAGVIALAYPLHPPGKPDVLRVAHFAHLTSPVLFVSGTKDEFGSPAEFAPWMRRIPAAVEHRWIDGARHDLRNHDDAVAQLCATWVGRLSH